MKKRMYSFLAILIVLSMVLVACGATPEPTAPAAAEGVKVVVIGKSVHPYWSNVEKGVIAAGKDLGVETVFFVPPKEDVAAQIQTMETYIAQGVTGIAIAPSDPNALEATMKKATDAGIFVTTLDTPPVDNSVSLVYIGTDNFTAGKMAGQTMATLLPNGGKVGIGRGSDTALNALQRTDGFLEGIAGTQITALEPVNDKEDAATALQLANSVISANPDLAGAFGVYAYNGPAWATAIKEANAAGKIKLVSFDATTDIINGIKEGVIDATVAQREYDMGYKSVQIINLMAQKGLDAALTEMGAVDGVIDTGVDVITAATLKDYEATLDAKGIPHEWNTEGWTPPTGGAQPTGPVKVVVIGKSVHPYWSNVEKGVIAAGKDLGVETVFFVPPKEDVAAQIQTMETYIAQGVTGIAIAPSDPNALEATMKKATDAGIFVTTLDTPPVDNSVSLVYIGTDNFTAGKMAGQTMATLLPSGGKVGIGRGSDTALNALQRTDGFLEGIAGTQIETLEPVNDKEDAATALQLANSVISANPDLAGAFGVYAYNGPAWATAIKEANAAGKIKLVSFDATTDIINGIKECVIDATVAQREYDMGYKSVQIITLMAQKGTDSALTEMGSVQGVIDTGVDVITSATLKDYEATLDAKGIPHEWNTEGWDATACGATSATTPEKLIIAWIPKSLNNPVFEVGRDGAFKKAEELTAAGTIPVSVEYVGSVASDAAEQARVVEDVVAKGVSAIGISCNDPTACEDPINKAVAAGVPVMAWDSDSPDSQRFTYLGVDNYQGGMAAAELLVRFMGETGQVGLLTGVPGAFNLEERIRGFKDGLAAYPGIEIATTVYCNDDINLGVQVVEETMQANPDLNGWFFVGLWPLFAERGSMPLWEDAALNQGLVTIAFDTLPVELEFMKDGYLQGLVGQKYWGWGYDTVQMIYDYILKGTRYDSWTDSGMDIVTKCNVDVMAEAWASSDFTTPLPDPYACLGGAAGPTPEKLTIAWIPKALNNPVFEVGRDGAIKKAEELTAAGPIPVEVDYVGSVASDAAEQARIVEDEISKGVSAVGISCNDPTACEDPINKAVAAGIPVMTWDSDSPDSQRFTYLGVDNYQGGKAAAELLVKFMGEKGKVALLTGVPGAFNLEERIRGFKDGVAAYPGIEIVTTVYCNDDINLGVQVVEETMQAHPDLNGWFFVGLWPLFAERGSMPLWEDAALHEGMVTISFDTLEVELGFLKDGYVQGLVGQKYWGWGYDTVQMIYDYIVKGTKYESWTDSGMDLVTKCNVDVMAEAWASSDFTTPLPDPYACLP